MESGAVTPRYERPIVPLTVFFAVIFAALLHATWNALVKTGASKQKSVLLLSACQSFFGLGIIAFRPPPVGEVWWWLLASGLIHCFYQLFLAYAYEQGDLSRVYPIARGTAPALVLLVSFIFAIDALDSAEFIGISILVLGIILMARGVFSSGESRKMLPFALGAAVATMGYSLVDGLGVRVHGDAIGYVAWLMVFSGVFYSALIFALQGREPFCWTRSDFKIGAITGVASYGAYVIAVWAMTQAPIALVTALRESSILFAMLIGWLIFGDKMSVGKATAGGLIILGLLITRL